MNTKDKQGFADAFQALCLIHGKTFTKDLALVWWDALKGLPFDQVKKALRQLCGSSDKMPKPKSVRLLCKAVKTLNALSSWGELRIEASKRGLPTCSTMTKIELLELLDVETT